LSKKEKIREKREERRERRRKTLERREGYIVLLPIVTWPQSQEQATVRNNKATKKIKSRNMLLRDAVIEGRYYGWPG
jgi:hypothetical protein